MAFLRKIFVFVACVVSLNGFAHTIAIPDGDKKLRFLFMITAMKCTNTCWPLLVVLNIL